MRAWAAGKESANTLDRISDDRLTDVAGGFAGERLQDALARLRESHEALMALASQVAGHFGRSR